MPIRSSTIRILKLFQICLRLRRSFRAFELSVEKRGAPAGLHRRTLYKGSIYNTFMTKICKNMANREFLAKILAALLIAFVKQFCWPIWACL